MPFLHRRPTVGRRNRTQRVCLELTELDRRDVPAVIGPSPAAPLVPTVLTQPATLVASPSAIASAISASQPGLTGGTIPTTATLPNGQVVQTITPFRLTNSPLTANPFALPFGLAVAFDAAAATTAPFPGLTANLPNLSSPASAAATTTTAPSPTVQSVYGPPPSNALLTHQDSGYAEPIGDATPAPNQVPTPDGSKGADLTAPPPKANVVTPPDGQ
jgi:hypothetical protein